MRCRQDNDSGHYQFEVGENLAARFKIMRKFGEGTFGQVGTQGGGGGGGGECGACNGAGGVWQCKAGD